MAASADTSAGFSKSFYVLLFILIFKRVCQCQDIPLVDNVGVTEDVTEKDQEINMKTANEIQTEELFGEVDDTHIKEDPSKVSDGQPTLIKNDKGFYSYSMVDSDGKTVDLKQYLGKVTLVVNVASECGFTDGHYKGLIRLWNVLSTTNKFEILAFPCNQFGAQEPASNDDIQTFVHNIYHVNFPVFAKINVLEDQVPEAWQFLISSFGEAPNWNFWKYLVDEDGQVVNAWGPWISVEDIFHEVKEAIDKIGFKKPRPDRHGGEL